MIEFGLGIVSICMGILLMLLIVAIIKIFMSSPIRDELKQTEDQLRNAVFDLKLIRGWTNQKDCSDAEFRSAVINLLKDKTIV